MNFFEIAFGVAVLAAAVFALQLARPIAGKVRWWLHGDAREAGYAIFLIGLVTIGFSQIVKGIVP